ncbi:MAG: diguanylate cyclase [Methyloprofundus sp.]|nr:diguanylate cyclase [Methyloprofundus sp.]
MLFHPLLIFSGHTVTINTSIGISLYPEDATNSGKLITLADNAMYLSKSKGMGHFHFCQEL